LASPDILTGIIAAVVFGASPTRLVLLVCTAQVLAQIGAYTWPALLPGMMPLWKLTYSEAGWITGVFYAAYTRYVVYGRGPRFRHSGWNGGFVTRSFPRPATE
jgi:hypothetical protein